MDFSSLIFIFLFLPIFLAAYFISPGRVKKLTFLLFSFIFYFWVAGNYIFILIFSILFNYFTGIALEKRSNEKKGKLILTAGIIANILILVYFKYLLFIMMDIYSVLGLSISPGLIKGLSGFPVGISFYTFVAISYLTDVFRKSTHGFTNVVDTALFFSMFPKLMAGPITLHSEFSPQLTTDKKRTYDFDSGVKRIIIGLGKKVLLADYLTKTADNIFLIPNGELTFGLAWLGAVTYTLALYLDFSGYSDIAIGIGKMLGYEIPENFNFPYISRSIKEFWKRWHMTLSKWLQIYIFLPVAYSLMRKIKKDRFWGMKVENFAYIFASFFTMVICGLWHGAAWTFILWGAFHGFMLVSEHLFFRKFLKSKKLLYLQWIYAQFVIVIGWIIFRSEDLGQVKDFLRSMFGFGKGTGVKYYTELYINPELAAILILGILASFPVFGWIKNRIVNRNVLFLNVIRPLEFLFMVSVFFLSVMTISAGTYNPFIYFRF